ncbi:MAG TPA: hypothetical protein VFS11_00770 [Gemmatimonadales bacterium]|nr:hypothetical protein [Gemmatimonadales bacterium]
MRSRADASWRVQRRALWIGLAVLCVVFALAVWWTARRAHPAPAPGHPAESGAVAVPTSGDPLQPYLPDPKRTPGATLAVAAADICVPGYSRKVRNVPSSVKRDVYRSYGINAPPPRRYEVDHLISLELGGSNSERNLWPESYETQPWNAHRKDELENELHRRVCAGKLDLGTAQHEIATDWIAAYQKYLGTPRQRTGAP